MAGCRRFRGSSGCSPVLAEDPASGERLGVEGGILCQLLRSPDYNLFPKSAVFESNFIQVTKQGNWVDIHNAPTLVTLGVTSSEPCLPLPNVLLIARLTVLGDSPPGRAGLPHEPSVALSRLLPLRYVRLSVQDCGRRLLQVQLVTGKVYYLRLHQAHPDAVFVLWSRLADILQRGLSITTKDPAIHVPHCLVLSAGSSSTSSPAQLVPDSQPPSGACHSVVARMGKRLSGTLSQLSGAALGKMEKDGVAQRRLFSWNHMPRSKSPAREEESGAPSWSAGKLAVCEQCRGRRPSDTGEKSSLRTALRWLDTKCHGVWERDTPAGLLPLSRLSSLVAAGARAAFCPGGWLNFQDNCYGYFPKETSWSRAEVLCRSQGRGIHLASIHSEEEHNAVAEFVTRSQRHDDNNDDGGAVWIGLHFPVGSRRWSWVDGFKPDFHAWDSDRSDSSLKGRTVQC